MQSLVRAIPMECDQGLDVTLVAVGTVFYMR
jgi:hypothetical protein